MMDLGALKILISYSQLAVFDPSLDRPFNGWTDRHVAQGFAWRPGSVGFRTIEGEGHHLVSVRLDSAEDEPGSPNGLRIIDVPFEVSPAGVIEVASISDGARLKLPPGRYRLRFECYGRESDSIPTIRLSFFRSGNPTFEIVRADPDLSPGVSLDLTASPA